MGVFEGLFFRLGTSLEGAFYVLRIYSSVAVVFFF